MKPYNFKRCFLMATIMVVSATFFSCEEKDIIQMAGNADLGVDKTNLIFKPGDSSKEVKVITQEEWDYTVDEEWVHVARGGNGNKLTVQADENRTEETRECLLTVYAVKDSKKRTIVKISQLTSLATISCSETELNFEAHEGAINTLTVRANGEWEVRRAPEWLRPSVSSGKGNKTITFTTLSANKTSRDRTGEVSIASSDGEASVKVRQYGGTMANCEVTPLHITALSNGIAFDMDYSRAGNVAHYYRGYMEASRSGIMTNQEIIDTLKNKFQRHLPSDDEVADFPGLKPNTKYIIYTLAYDMEGRRGDLKSTTVWTRKKESDEPFAWIENWSYTDSYWEWQIKKSGTCYSFYMMTTEDKDIAFASDPLQAWWLEEAVRQNKATEYFNGGDWRQRRGGNAFAVWTRGKKSDGTLAGTISWLGLKENSSRAKGKCASLRKTAKRNEEGDHSGRKLSPDQYRLYMMK